MVEKTPFSDSELNISRLEGDDFNDLKDFSCGTECLDQFFHNEIELCAKYKYLSPYCAKIGDEIVGVFTLAADALMLETDDKEDFPNMNEEYRDIFPLQTSFPAINIGHLGVKSGLQSKRIGEQIVRFVVATFSQFNGAGCQFITVDSLNNPRTNKFYSRLGFYNQSNNDSTKPTRRMYLDIFLPIEEMEEEEA